MVIRDVNMHEVTSSSMQAFTIREAIVERFADHPRTNWLTMPPIYPKPPSLN
jgi:hypothetical protein